MVKLMTTVITPSEENCVQFTEALYFSIYYLKGNKKSPYWGNFVLWQHWAIQMLWKEYFT